MTKEKGDGPEKKLVTFCSGGYRIEKATFSREGAAPVETENESEQG